jgi:RNA polymerase primary sigma factor
MIIDAVIKQPKYTSPIHSPSPNRPGKRWQNSSPEKNLLGSVLIEAEHLIPLYLREAGRTPLLTPAEEGSLARQFKKGRRAEKQLAQATCTSEQIRQLKNDVEQGRQARDHLIKANTRLVISIAKEYAHRGVGLLDLIQEGNLGLIRAVEKFDYRRGNRFSTYASWWIRQAVSRALSNQARTIRVPVHLSERLLKLGQISEQLEQARGRKPTLEELAAEMGLSIALVQRLRLVADQYSVSLEQSLDDQEDNTLADYIANDDALSPPDLADNSLLRTKLEEALAILDHREAKIIKLRFGLENGQSHTLREVGQKFNLTRERIRQIESKALTKLRLSCCFNDLKDYL